MRYLPIHDISDQPRFSVVELPPAVYLIFLVATLLAAYFELEKRMLLKFWKQIQRASLTWVYLMISHPYQLLMIMRQPALNLFNPYMTNNRKNISITCDIANYSLKKTLLEKGYHQHSIPYYSSFNEQIITVMLGKVLVPPFWNYPLLLEMDGWRVEKY